MIAIVKYNAGNIRSVDFALRRLGVEPVITNNPDELIKAEKVIFPGVGEAATAMKYLVHSGLDKVIVSLNQPVLGICLGMQLMCKSSDEGDVNCMGIFDTTVTRFTGDIKIPHVGWNSISELKGPLFKNIPEEAYMYFVHSYFVSKFNYSSALVNYSIQYSAAIQSNNFFGVQFHPEKSGTMGEKILKNFLML